MYVEMTYHAREERIDRLAKCVEILGLGKIIIQARDKRYPGTVRKITSTGIVLVMEEKTDKLITGYMATPCQMYTIYSEARITRIPPKIYNRVHKNMELFSYLLDV